MSARHDAGLHAVARVRAVRERDSRIGLQQALREARERAQESVRLDEALDAHRNFVSGDLAELTALRLSMAALGHEASSARRAHQAAETTAMDAGAHWQIDHSRLGAVEGLLERRAEERTTEQRRVAATELDDIAGRSWLRARKARA